MNHNYCFVIILILFSWLWNLIWNFLLLISIMRNFKFWSINRLAFKSWLFFNNCWGLNSFYLMFNQIYLLWCPSIYFLHLYWLRLSLFTFNHLFWSASHFDLNLVWEYFVIFNFMSIWLCWTHLNLDQLTEIFVLSRRQNLWNFIRFWK